MWLEPVPLALSESLLYVSISSAHDGVFELLTLRAPKSTAAASGVWRGVLNTFRAFASADDADSDAPSPSTATSPRLFIAVLVRGEGERMVVAQSDARETMEQHWAQLTRDWWPRVKDEPREEAVRFVLDKVRSLARVEEQDGGDEARAKFGAALQATGAARLEAQFGACVLWRTDRGGVTSARESGTLFIFDCALGFDGASRHVLSLREVAAVHKAAAVLGLVSAGLRVQHSGGEWWLLVAERDVCFGALEKAWSRNMTRWQRALDPTLAARDADDAAEQRARLFALPKDEYALDELDRALPLTWAHSARPQIMWRGSLTLTRAFLCLEGVDDDGVLAESEARVRCVVSLADVTLIEPDEARVRVLSGSGNSLMLAPDDDEGAMALLRRLVERWNACVLHRRRLSSADGTQLASQGWTRDEARLMRSGYVKREQRARRAWQAWLTTAGELDDVLVDARAAELAAVPGIPDAWRARLWLLGSGALHSLHAHPGHYAALVARVEGAEAGTWGALAEEIDRDVPRSLPQHSHYRDDASGSAARASLRRVLLAYGASAPHIGYAQAMNVVAATALLYLNEEETFWLLHFVCEQLLPSHYSKGLQLLGAVCDQHVFAHLARTHFPALVAHLESLNVAVAMLFLPWSLCLFIGYIRWESSLRVLDLVLWHGAPALFRIGLALLQLSEGVLLEVRDEGERVAALLKSGQHYRSDDLIRVAVEDFAHVDARTLKSLRQQHLHAAMRDLERSQHNRDLRALKATWTRLSEATLRAVLELERADAATVSAQASAASLRSSSASSASASASSSADVRVSAAPWLRFVLAQSSLPALQETDTKRASVLTLLHRALGTRAGALRLVDSLLYGTRAQQVALVAHALLQSSAGDAALVRVSELCAVIDALAALVLGDYAAAASAHVPRVQQMSALLLGGAGERGVALAELDASLDEQRDLLDALWDTLATAVAAPASSQ